MNRILLVALLGLAAINPTFCAKADAGSTISLKLMTEELGAPIGLVPIPDGSGRLFVAEQAGLIQLLDHDRKKSAQPFLDLREKIVPLGKGMEERGLLGLALHPQFKANHKFYVVYSAPLRTNAPPKWDHAERLSEFRTTGADFATADPASERVVLEIDEPDWNHNSGRLAFGPDGHLYWTVGDGGAFNDVGDVARGRGHPSEGNGQKLDTLLGKVLRIDVDHGAPYGIPKDNPYVDGKKGLPEIFAYGLRNPWGISFDRGGKHDLIVVDVGQDRWEEINVIVKGGNYGWRVREGFDGFDPKNPKTAPADAPCTCREVGASILPRAKPSTSGCTMFIRMGKQSSNMRCASRPISARRSCSATGSRAAISTLSFPIKPTGGLSRPPRIDSA